MKLYFPVIFRGFLSLRQICGGVPRDLLNLRRASTANISVSVAALQLIEVQDVLGAIHNADATTAKRLADQAFAHEYDRGHDQVYWVWTKWSGFAQPGQVIQELPTYVPGRSFICAAIRAFGADRGLEPAVAPHLTLPLHRRGNCASGGQASLTIVIKKMAERPVFLIRET